jgi:[protein-PII] uridylyltransferase
MPASYREAFDGMSARQHAAIVARRGSQVAHVEIWKREPRERAILCVVAEDRPGLLSLISASLAAQNLDVITAQAYTRTPEGTAQAEAVDLLLVHHDTAPPKPVSAADVARVAETLEGLLGGDVTLEEVLQHARRTGSVPAGASTRVTFDQGASSSDLAVLAVETFDRPGLLLTITLALFRAQVQIVASDARTENGRVVDRFTLAELDGAPVLPYRRGAVQTAVLTAIDAIVGRRHHGG